MRILTLSWEYPPIVEGGLARHVRKLSEQLVRDGHEVHVVTRGGGRLETVELGHLLTPNLAAYRERLRARPAYLRAAEV